MTEFEGYLGNIYGKLGKHVFVKGKKKRVFLRKLVKPGSKKNEPALRDQYKRTATLNVFAAEVSSILDQYYPTYRDRHQYQQILGRMRKAPAPEHILALQALKGFDLKAKYPLNQFLVPDLKITQASKSISVHLTLTHHPEPKSGDGSDYFLELMMLEWGAKGNAPSVDRQATEWIKEVEPLPSFRFNFARSADTRRWMLLLRLVMGKDSVPTEAHSAQSIRVMEVGTYVDAEKKLLEKKPARKLRTQSTRDTKDVPRVKRL